MNEQIIFIAPLLDRSNLSYKLTKIIDVPFIIFLIQITHSSSQCKISAYIKYGRRFDLELRRRSLKREMIDSMVDSLIGSASQKRVHSKSQKRDRSKPQYWEYYRFRNDTNIG